MKVNLFEPTVRGVMHIPSARPGGDFPLIILTDEDGGTVDLYPGDNWEAWDAVVAAVNEYRSVK